MKTNKPKSSSPQKVKEITKRNPGIELPALPDVGKEFSPSTKTDSRTDMKLTSTATIRVTKTTYHKFPDGGNLQEEIREAVKNHTAEFSGDLSLKPLLGISSVVITIEKHS